MLKNALGAQNFGRLLYLKHLLSGKIPKTPLNGQKIRIQIFQELLNVRAWGQIVETGSFLGATTRFFANTGLPVITIEANPEYHAYTQMRFLLKGRVKVLHGDSRNVLTSLAQTPSFTRVPTIFYLDAHWDAELPLQEEVRTIFRNFVSPVVMIDDFCVPGTAYGFDNYGNGVVLNQELLSAVIWENNLGAYFPKAPAELETGGRRGTVFLFSPDFSGSLSQGLKHLLQRAEPVA